jgi:hypothetical protein
MITCLFSGGVAAFGLYLLSLCAVKTPHRRASFFAVAELTFPKAAVFFDAAIAIKCFGVSIRYGAHYIFVRYQRSPAPLPHKYHVSQVRERDLITDTSYPEMRLISIILA